MARNILIQTLVARAQRRVDLENDNRLSTATSGAWRQFLSEVLAELYAEVSQAGDRYFETTADLTTTGATTYTLTSAPAISVMFLVGVSRVDGTRRWPLFELEAQERDAFAGVGSDGASAYALRGDVLILDPTPPSGQTYRISYIPQPTDHSASADGTNIDVVSPAGERFLLSGMAALARASGQEDARFELEQKELARRDVIMEAVNRRLRSPPRRMVDDDPWDGGGGYPGDWP